MRKLLKSLPDRYRALSVNVRAGLWYTACSFIQRGISFITVPVFTRLLSVEQYGTVSIYNSWQSVLMIFCTLNLFSGVFNNGMVKFEKDRESFLSSVQGLVTLLTLFFFGIYLIFHQSINQFLSLDTEFVIFMFAEILMNAAFNFWAGRERFEFRYRKMIFVTLLVSILSPVVAVVAVLLANEPQKDLARIAGSAVVVIIVYGIIYVINWLRGKHFFQKAYWKYALSFNIPLVPHYLSMLVLNQSDRLMIDKLVGRAEAGIYGLSHNLAMVMNIFATSVNNAFAPWLYQQLKKEDYKSVKPVGTMLFLLMAGVTFLIMAFAPELVLLLAGRVYYEAIYVIPPLAVSIYFVFMYQIFANVEFYFEENRFIMYASVGGGILNIILNYVFIKKFGYVAAGYTTLVCYMIFGVCHYLFMQHTLKKHLTKAASLFDIRGISAITMLLMIASFFILLLYKLAIIRYVLIGILLICLFIYRRTIKKTFDHILGGENI